MGQSGKAGRPRNLGITKFGALGLVAMLGLTACGAARDEVLSGTRVDLREGSVLGAAQSETPENRTVSISLGKQVARSAWTMTGGGRTHDAGHNAFTAATPSVIWSAKIGEGKSRKTRLTVDPVAANGLIVAMDAQARLTAVSAESGAPAWSVDLTPAGEKAGKVFGGALAISGKQIFATTGYGDLIALDLASGTEIWRQRLDAVGAAGLSVYDGLAYVVAGNGRVWAVNTVDGRVKWQITGPESVTSRAGATSPAIGDKFAVLPFSSGDLYGVFRKGGVRYWSASLAGQRKGVVYANVSDITSDPVVIGNRFYVGNQSGRYAAFDMDTGSRLWTADEGAYSPASIVGGSVFIVTDRNELVRLSATTGERIWGQQLPYFTTDKERKRKTVFAHYGPVAAGGKLWVASDDAVLRGFDPASGALVASVALPKGASSDPIVVGGVMYILLEDGSLAALR
ncbi:Outer membrane protein assembly factor BamB, contains PQQ-like beta-propeller repeat [Celeribacter neptunius]|uniref:Outer membrane protein assembly factor BamB, contains PQQ-like beta-propeller repeat n=2 Tax=Celeribacter neptunius TaxID=588602 RepID=A0A1I3KAJ1_9RHOB|nr:Outer membrane protein assembly factor BamB, contains PQQ-like beta-propeller repeat [Celeribacter neptunius]